MDSQQRIFWVDSPNYLRKCHLFFSFSFLFLFLFISLNLFFSVSFSICFALYSSFGKILLCVNSFVRFYIYSSFAMGLHVYQNLIVVIACCDSIACVVYSIVNIYVNLLMCRLLRILSSFEIMSNKKQKRKRVRKTNSSTLWKIDEKKTTMKIEHKNWWQQQARQQKKKNL